MLKGNTEKVHWLCYENGLLEAKNILEDILWEIFKSNGLCEIQPLE